MNTIKHWLHERRIRKQLRFIRRQQRWEAEQAEAEQRIKDQRVRDHSHYALAPAPGRRFDADSTPWTSDLL